MREVLKFSYKNDIDIIYIPSINTEIDALCKKLGLIKNMMTKDFINQKITS